MSRLILLTVFLINFCVLLFVSCQVKDAETTGASLGPDRALSLTTRKIQRLLNEKYHLTMGASGQGGTMTSVDLLILGFQSTHCVDEQQARMLIVGCVIDTLNVVNNSDELKPWLANFPFEPENLMLTLSFDQDNCSLAAESYLAAVSENGGSVNYRYRRKGQIFGFSDTKEESFEEALSIVRLCEGIGQ